MRDTNECIISIGYALFAVIKVVFINRNDLEMIMNNIYKNNKFIKIENRKKTKKKTNTR